ncbi:hypothetical protein [Dokdonella soli]|uniref:hypothetical protein n=1 Tax=Dokdonella soli TaxID=529810 RepID=UPI0031CFA2E4
MKSSCLLSVESENQLYVSRNPLQRMERTLSSCSKPFAKMRSSATDDEASLLVAVRIGRATRIRNGQRTDRRRELGAGERNARRPWNGTENVRCDAEPDAMPACSHDRRSFSEARSSSRRGHTLMNAAARESEQRPAHRSETAAREPL